MEQLALETKLERLGYFGLFRAPDGHLQIDRLWDEPGASEQLLRLALDVHKPWLVRFLAGEMILHKQMFLLRKEHFAQLASVYVKALTNNASGFMSDWGFQDSMSDTGTLGNRFLLFGRAADVALRALLDDSREIPYLYPADFPSGVRPGLRIRDFVTLYLSGVHQIPIHFTEDAVQRDQEIHRLKTLLPN